METGSRDLKLPEASKEPVKDLADSIKTAGQQKAEEGLHTAADQVQSIAGALDTAAKEWSRNDQTGLSSYAQQIAGNVSKFADGLQNRSVDSLMGDATDFARRNPGAFLAGSVAVGFLVSRFLKAGTDRASGQGLASQRTQRTQPTQGGARHV